MSGSSRAFLKTFCDLETCRRYCREHTHVTLDIRRLEAHLGGSTAPACWLRTHFIPLDGQDLRAVVVFVDITEEVTQRQFIISITRDLFAS